MEILEKIKDFIIKNKKNIIIITSYIFIIIIFIISLLIIYSNNAKKLKRIENKNKISLVQHENENKEEIKKVKIFVDVKGAVVKPGVYELEEGKRVNDAIHLAGGFTKDANTRYINLSKVLKDEMVIVVYNNKEIKDILEVKAETPCICKNTMNDSCIENITEKENNNNIININTATKEELMTLTGIGETKANAIIEYREVNGYFINIEDIMKVNGISESTYSKIKDFITIK